MLEFFRVEFTLANIGSEIMWTLILGLAGRLLMITFNKTPRREWHYWIFGLFGIFLMVAFIQYATGFGQSPRFVPLIDTILTAEADYFLDPGQPTRKGGLIMPIISIRNLGAPSIAENYGLSITYGGSGPIKGQSAAVRDGTITMSNGRQEKIYHADAITEKTISEPIPRGGFVRGRLLFLFDGVTADRLNDPTLKVTLTLTDAWGKKYSADFYSRGGTTNTQMMFPGLTPGS